MVTRAKNVSGESIGGAALIRGRRLLIFLSQMQRLIKGVAYSSKYGILTSTITLCLYEVLVYYVLCTFYYFMANPVLGKSLCSDWFLFGQDSAVRTVSTETAQPLYFCFTYIHIQLIENNLGPRRDPCETP